MGGGLGNLLVAWRSADLRPDATVLLLEQGPAVLGSLYLHAPTTTDPSRAPPGSEAFYVQRLFTPADFKTELNAHVGSAFSLEPVLWQSAYFRVHNRDPDIGGLYFVGAGRR